MFGINFRNLLKSTSNPTPAAVAPSPFVDAVSRSPIAMRAAAVNTITRLSVSDLLRNGKLKHQANFRFNVLTIRNLQNRKAVLAAIGRSKREEFMAIPFEQRKVLFALVKQETARYNGTAIRQRDTVYGKKGEPLPKLGFPTPNDAAAYRQILQQAMSTMRRHISN